MLPFITTNEYITAISICVTYIISDILLVYDVMGHISEKDHIAEIVDSQNLGAVADWNKFVVPI